MMHDLSRIWEPISVAEARRNLAEAMRAYATAPTPTNHAAVADAVGDLADAEEVAPEQHA